ncbi:unnamed protein product [Sphagnum troendelagicum]|uniref:AAA+ ATPase domain-containing protein n=1 Tax=Sphagnum troendelagicum TaxID=128251 RepID=A0ABP0V339_9BRYO
MTRAEAICKGIMTRAEAICKGIFKRRTCTTTTTTLKLLYASCCPGLLPLCLSLHHTQSELSTSSNKCLASFRGRIYPHVLLRQELCKENQRQQQELFRPFSPGSNKGGVHEVRAGPPATNRFWACCCYPNLREQSLFQSWSLNRYLSSTHIVPSHDPQISLGSIPRSKHGLFCLSGLSGEHRNHENDHEKLRNPVTPSSDGGGGSEPGKEKDPQHCFSGSSGRDYDEKEAKGRNYGVASAPGGCQQERGDHQKPYYMRKSREEQVHHGQIEKETAFESAHNTKFKMTCTKENLLDLGSARVSPEKLPQDLSENTRDPLVDCAASAHLTQTKCPDCPLVLPSSSCHACIHGPPGTHLHPERQNAEDASSCSIDFHDYRYGEILSGSDVEDSDSEGDHVVWASSDYTSDMGAEFKQEDEEFGDVRNSYVHKFVDVLLTMAVRNASEAQTQKPLSEREQRCQSVGGIKKQGSKHRSLDSKLNKGDRVKFVSGYYKIMATSKFRQQFQVGQRVIVVSVPNSIVGIVHVKSDNADQRVNKHLMAKKGLEELGRQQNIIEWCDLSDLALDDSAQADNPANETLGPLEAPSQMASPSRPLVNLKRPMRWVFRELLGTEDLYQLYINNMRICLPKNKEQLLQDWKKQVVHHEGKRQADQNLEQLVKIIELHNTECPELLKVNLQGLHLTEIKAERIVQWAIDHHLGLCLLDPATSNGKLMIPRDSMERALTRLRDQEIKKAPNVVKDFKTVAEDEYEKALISAVIPPNEVGVKFDQIGALENVKAALKELVMLPLQRPELFCKGNLTRPCKGVLLFGPPGTGKTLLAKAVATEAGANFINITGSTITSKWFGDAEKLTKALFSLARKLSPAVIFVDEVDSLLGARGGSSEHEATRKTRNEFMAAWDGLRSKDNERVLVLAATNRPFDLDDAVVRRLPRRILVDLPNCENRVKILRVILADEELSQGFDYGELARMTDGYSGSDLKNLSIAAAYRPIRELLELEEQQVIKSSSVLLIRALQLDDFTQAMTQVGASVAFDASSMNELRRWNEQYGEGGNRRKSSFGFVV